jgi:FkbM family methyltransferase
MTRRPYDHTLSRASLTIGCRDAESIPKVPDAGRVEILEDGPVQIMHNGLKVAYGGYYGDWMANIITGLRGHHEPQEERVFHELLRYCRPRSWILELGAFWAYYTMWFMRAVPFGSGVCVEPDPRHLEVGKLNLRLNGLNPAFEHAAVGSRDVPDTTFETENGATVTIPTVTVAGLMTAHAIPAVEILHLDIQGGEAAVLESCAPLFDLRRIRFVVCSTHHSSISGSTTTHADCLAFLRSHGANIICEHNVDESFSGDGLIAAAMWEEDHFLAPIEVSRCRREQSLFPTGY